jgi:GTP-binding protein EngB required for normal cell division
MNSPFHQRPPSDYGSNGYEEGDDDFDTPPSYTATLGSVRLGTDDDNIRLLNQVDQLRECRVDEYIELPQIVVVGDQSTGKSSILDALTEIPFPRDSVRCTRFATQIRLRRSNEVRTVIGIIPDKSRSPEERQRLAEFKQTLEDQADFGTIFDKAIGAIFPNGSRSSFLSKDILSIEISGPKQPHLTVVDLPGIIHAATMNQTIEDKDAITSLARSYMQKERTIILAVVSCSNDISNQVVLEMAKELDPRGIRTLGVITKPDMALTKERATEFIYLASNKDKRNRLLLGWHVLRNRAHDEGHFTPDQRRRTEREYFANSIWGKKLRESQLGVDALSKRLSTQLIRHIAAEVFKVQADIDRELEKCKEKILELGDGKDTPEEMRAELFRWCERSVRLTHAAVQGHGINPSGEDFLPSYNDGKTYARNLRSRVVKENRAFGKKMEDLGADCVILDDEGSPNRRTPQQKDGTRSSLPEITRSDYLRKEVVPLLEDNPGKELPMDNNPLLVFRLFQSYSRNWSTHAEQHILEIHKLCEEFLFQVLHLVWPKQIQSRVWASFIQTEVKKRFVEAEEELKKLKTDRLRFVAPCESDFLEKYYAWKGVPLATEQGPVELPDQRYEDLLQKMLFLYKVSTWEFDLALTDIL